MPDETPDQAGERDRNTENETPRVIRHIVHYRQTQKDADQETKVDTPFPNDVSHHIQKFNNVGKVSHCSAAGRIPGHLIKLLKQAEDQLREQAEGEDSDGKKDQKHLGKRRDFNGDSPFRRRLPVHRAHDLEVVIETAGDGDGTEDDQEILLVLEGGDEDEEFTEESDREGQAARARPWQ